ncbi:hypothetical protein HYDPIDRAFT_28502 [Hydnomerulius pinastri MD-312]|uniref:Uncharacterized protein n=1 Tax=Hydnomerulius pinastri MD-312 TaxID=994086 RepID=A0A0C9W148_9AGAM|nr:hypothetical protein HYDPIDRAFT_28502 [Hydnomerulius pinastri MD-312]
MPIPRLCSAIAIVAACLPLALADIQPGSDYGVYKTTNLYNCTGHVMASNVTVPNAADTLPQIASSSRLGWEQWDLFMHGTFPMILRWTQGDPSTSMSAPSAGKFEMLILDPNANGTLVHGSTTGRLSYTNDENFKQISLKDNSLTWDASAQWYNLTVSAGGYSMTLNSFSSMLDTFHPNVEFYNGMLDKAQGPGWFGSVPLPRGHASGYLDGPHGERTSLSGLTVMRHMFSQNALPNYINKYSMGTAWGYSKAFYDTHVFYQTEATNGTVHDAAYLGRAIPTPGEQGIFSTASAVYAITDDYTLYNLAVNPKAQTLDASFPGCPSTNNIAYVFNMSTSTMLGQFTDLGGGKTTYYAINGSTTAGFDGKPVVGTLSGVFEEYEAPSLDLD